MAQAVSLEPEAQEEEHDDHQRKVARICESLRSRTSTKPLSLRKRQVAHEVPKCIAEPGVPFDWLVRETLRLGLVPKVVPELRTITFGGAVSGCSLESMSFRYGGFHDSCLAYAIITAKGNATTQGR